MIRINQSGMSKAEWNSVCRPLADNADGNQDIHTLGDNLAIAVQRYDSVFSEAIEQINRDATNEK